MLVKLAIPRVSLADETVLRMVISSAMMGGTIWIQTSFISAIPGILQSFVMQSDLTGYIRFTSRAFFVRMASMLVGGVFD